MPACLSGEPETTSRVGVPAALCYLQQNPCGALCGTLRTEDPAIEIPLEGVFRQTGL